MRIVTIGEEIIFFGRPRRSGLVHCLDVARRCRVEHMNTRIHLIGVLNHLIQVFEPHIPTHVVEVVSHGEHNLVGVELLCLFFSVFNQFTNLNVISK